jgi:hypothetical protein
MVFRVVGQVDENDVQAKELLQFPGFHVPDKAVWTTFCPLAEPDTGSPRRLSGAIRNPTAHRGSLVQLSFMLLN